MTIKFAGSRIGLTGRPGADDRFERFERVEGITADRGPVAVTARVQGIKAGEWRVTAIPVRQESVRAGTSRKTKFRPTVSTHRTRLATLVYGPAVRLATWPALVGVGAVAAIAVQAILLGREDLNVVAAVVISVVACLVGNVGARIWCLALHRKHPRHFLTVGACIQGFLLGAVGALAIGAAAFRLPLGALLDATAPGIYLGMAIGRPGCFFTGCCAGRPTSSRWGVWSSDRRVAIRRFPVQLVEAAVALVIGVAALALVLGVQPPVRGAVFVGALSAYTFCRQLLFPLRTESRTRLGRLLTMVACGLLFVASAGTFAMS
ncbi:diacylglyceryl transferase [Allosaccharopolyspora coralli]|uniref:Diacylglyceryl transferase n=1 Tax=Allosaccharopolyspora coralli TaxID=2665642 RepID=A0A5Q3QAL0_9PSEU|nr:prolipoprotein diacylglyceryl transferase family protein [Allosaccharopolyspora coralli]QGK70234.1 diacylglyceryl transferase [Allosaccharopolyspora coralli]